MSSVYRDRADYGPRLVDGDLETAWNSASGERLGSFVEVRLPADVTVTGIALTVGFTHRTDSNDLFTGNLRIAEVKVLRDGQELGTFPLDPENRALQPVAISGSGGTYRIEVTRLVEGSHADWTETCISELQVLGRSPIAHPGERTPRVTVGTLPPAPPPLDRAAFAARWDDVVSAFERSFIGYEWSASRAEQNTDTEQLAEDRPALAAQIEGLTRRVASAIEGLDGLAADRVRRLLVQPVSTSYSARATQLATLVDALRAVASSLGTPAARCRVERAHAHVRFERMAATAEYDRYMAEVNGAFGSGSGAGNPSANTASGTPETMRESRRLVNQARQLFARSEAEALASLDGHPVERVSPDVAPLLESLRAAQQMCPGAR